MNEADVQAILENNGYKITSKERLPNDKGWQIRCSEGQVVSVYDSGKIVVQGKNKDKEAIEQLLNQGTASPKDPRVSQIVPGKTRKVFVVYGHDTQAKTALEAMLRRWDLDPFIMDQLPSGGQTIIEKLESFRKEVNFAVVLATPDDEGYRVEHRDEKAFRARQNVVLELGMMLSILGRDRVAILLKDQDKMERPSDIQGLIYIPFKENVEEVKLLLAKELNAKGIPIDLNRI